MDKLFEELVAVDSDRAFNFFLTHLREVSTAKDLRGDEMMYVALVLSQYCETSRFNTASMPFPDSLSDVFDYFVVEGERIRSPDILEIGARQVLLLAGFFREQMKGRHNVEWYDEVGRELYKKASHFVRDSAKRRLFGGMSYSFPAWTIACRNLNKTLYENRFILKVS